MINQLINYKGSGDNKKAADTRWRVSDHFHVDMFQFISMSEGDKKERKDKKQGPKRRRSPSPPSSVGKKSRKRFALSHLTILCVGASH